MRERGKSRHERGMCTAGILTEETKNGKKVCVSSIILIFFFCIGVSIRVCYGVYFGVCIGVSIGVNRVCLRNVQRETCS